VTISGVLRRAVPSLDREPGASRSRPDDPFTTRIPDGQVRVVFEHREDGYAFGSPRWFCWFRISEEGTHQGLPLLRIYNVPRGARIPRSHNLAIDYMALIGRRPPAKLRPERFLRDCEVLARVVTVRERVTDRGRVKLPEACWYSRVDELITITAGCPPCLRESP
jgi:hypothetical protein